MRVIESMTGYVFFREEDLKLKRASIVIGAVASVIFLLCVGMVAITLHLTPELNKLATGKPLTGDRLVSMLITSVK